MKKFSQSDSLSLCLGVRYRCMISSLNKTKVIGAEYNYSALIIGPIIRNTFKKAYLPWNIFIQYWLTKQAHSIYKLLYYFSSFFFCSIEWIYVYIYELFKQNCIQAPIFSDLNMPFFFWTFSKITIQIQGLLMFISKDLDSMSNYRS